MDGYIPTKISTPQIDELLKYFTYTAGATSNNQSSLETIVLNNKPHLLVNGLFYKVGLGSGAPSATQADSSGTPSSWLITSTNMTAQIAAYSIDDKVWWGLQILGYSVTNGANIRPATLFESAIQTGNYRQSIFLYDVNGGLSGHDAFFSTKARQLSQSGFSDSGTVLGVNQTTTEPIFTALALNPVWFDVETRKRINKIKIITDGVPTLTTTETPTLGLLVNRNNTQQGTGTNSLQRTMTIPTSNQRYVFNNYGMARQLQITVWASSRGGLSIRGVELDVAQGTS